MLFLAFVFTMSLTAHAATSVDGFYGTTWLDYVDEDGFGGGNFGKGTKDNPYQIRSAGALAYLAREVNNGQTFSGTYFVIAANIDLGYKPSGSPLVWVPIGCSTSSGFYGTLTNGTDANGNPYTISGMTIRAYGTGKTNTFGLFGTVYGVVEGLVLKNSTIYIDQTTSAYYAGALCGLMTTNSSITQCTAEGTTFELTSSNDDTCVGGLVGKVEEDIIELKSNLAKSTMRLTGPMLAGGFAGETTAPMFDCHAVIDAKINNTTSSDCYAGGVVGVINPVGVVSTSRYEITCCTSSGEIAGNGSNITMGGVVGYAVWYLVMNYCTTCVSLSGGQKMGGLIGYANSRAGGDGMWVDGCYCSSYIDGRAATYAGGLFGHVQFSTLGKCYITPLDNVRFTYFAGTMTKPTSSDKYGTIVGYVQSFQTSYKFGYFQVDHRQCALQTNSQGWADDGNNLATAVYLTPKPNNGDFRYDAYAEMPETYMVSQLNSHLFFRDNMRLASTPFNITTDDKAYFDLWDVTTDFRIGTYTNASTQEQVATFSITNPPSCIEMNENTAKVLDPGEVDVLVNYNGLQRKVHLDITYGKPWDGTIITDVNYPKYIAGGDGTAKNPYVIHTLSELYYFGKSYLFGKEEIQFNKAGKYFILANDLFINTHLLAEDESPQGTPQEWYSTPWYAHLNGNGKTIYGLYQNRENLDGGKMSGLFSSIEGTVTDLAIVDSYMRLTSSNADVSGGLLCGKLNGGTIERCLVHGLVQVDGYVGGLCGTASGGTISDCFSSVHVGWATNASLFHGAGMTYGTPSTMQRCVSTGKVESANTVYGLTSNGSACTNCYFDRQMLSLDNTTTGSTYTKDMLSGQILANASAWKNEENRYPMLRQFAPTPYGELLAMPVLFANNDRAGSIKQIFDFPTENVTWWANSGDKYLDVINECGAGAPTGQTGTYTEHLLAQTVKTKSECTKALRSMAVNVRADKAGIQFADDAVKAAALAAFDKDGDGLVVLREAFEATAAQFKTFNQQATDGETFNEMRYFAGFSTLQKDMISGLAKLREVTLPQTITTIATNAFNGCESLAEVELPHQFATLQEGGFYGSGIKNILVSPKNLTCQSIGGALYKNDPQDDLKVMLMAYPPGRGEEDATLSAPLSTILPYAIYKVPALKNVYIDNCLPDGQMAILEEDGIIHEDASDLMHVYVNDGSFNSQLFMEYYDDPDWGELYYDEGHLHIYYPLTVTSAGWATLYIDFPTQLPEGLKAYIADVPDEDNNLVTLHSIGRTIPKSTPVVIKAEEAGLYPLYKYEGTVPDVNKWENRFIGTFIGQDDRWGVPVNQETAVEGSILTLGRNKNGVVGFYKYNGTEIPPYRAYLTRNNIIEGSAAPLSIVFGDDVDGIETIDNSQLTIDNRTGAVYDLQGRRVGTQLPNSSTPQLLISSTPHLLKRGIYIYNGKKIVIK